MDRYESFLEPSVPRDAVSCRPSEPRIVVVSGLPRSGTSLMMQMLARGGMELLTDAARRPDEHNPRGYFELEAVKRLPDGSSDWISAAHGRAVKIISPLLPYLPAGHRYHVVFLHRHLEEIIRSQSRMQRTPTEGLEQLLRRNLSVTQAWLGRQRDIVVLYVSHARLISSPRVEAQRIARFLDANLHIDRMAACVDRSLQRSRATAADSKATVRRRG